MSDQSDQLAGVDFAVAAFHDGEDWTVEELADDVLSDVGALAHALRRFPGEGGAFAMVGVDEDFFLIVRTEGTSTHVLLSDITAASEWELAASALEHLALPMPEDEDDQEPAGDLAILADLGVSAVDLGILLDDFDLYPDELLSEVARKAGFGMLFDDAVGLTTA
ncbi:MAG: tRNA adenosine deaminase-associated protein [Nocardioides sp.]|uniref:tRNA adenosine deaminase-associated protein n=1 Tax=Nocardioides sp. TaxID=35761 RepID=UPI0039E23132